MTVLGVFLGSFLAVYELIISRRQHWPAAIGRLIECNATHTAIWVMFGLWLVWPVALGFGIPVFANTFQIFRSVAAALGIISVVYLMFQIGQRTLPDQQSLLVMCGVTFNLAMSIANGFLNGSVQWIGAAIAGFTLGRNRVPVVAVLVGCTILLTLLQLGKGEYGATYWEGGQGVPPRPM